MSISAAAKTTTTPANVKTDTGFCSICPSPTHPPATFRKRCIEVSEGSLLVYLLRTKSTACAQAFARQQRSVCCLATQRRDVAWPSFITCH